MPSGKVGRKWTRREDALLGTDTDEAVGKKIGLHKTTVWKRRLFLGIPSLEAKGGGRGSTRRKLPPDDALLTELAESGVSAVAKKYGVSRQAVYYMLEEIQTRKGTTNGDHQSAGTPQDVERGGPERPG